MYTIQYKNQQAFSFLRDGVQYQADLTYQIVLIPHLESLQYGVKPIFDEMMAVENFCIELYTFVLMCI